jgi:hypothetical protein
MEAKKTIFAEVDNVALATFYTNHTTIEERWIAGQRGRPRTRR